MTQGRVIAIFLTLALVSASCATTEKTHRYELAREYIARIHDAAYFGSDAQWLMSDRQDSDGAKLTKPSEVIDALLEKYFAATEDRVSKSCSEHYFVCSDPMAFEFLVRAIHNNEIMSSKSTKLASLDQWSKGGETDAQLFSVLGIAGWSDLDRLEAVSTSAQPAPDRRVAHARGGPSQ